MIALHANNTAIFGWKVPKITAEKLDTGNLNAAEEEFMLKVVDDLFGNKAYGSLHIVQSEDYFYDFNALVNDINYTRNTVTEVHHIFIDYLTLVKPKIGGRIETEDYNDMISQTRALALDLLIPIHTVAQLNRTGFDEACRDKKKHWYDLSAIYKYSEFEKSCTRVISIFQSPEMETSGEVQFQCLKTRDRKKFAPFRVIRDMCTGWHYENLMQTREDTRAIIESIEL
jgi:hypothetical protein